MSVEDLVSDLRSLGVSLAVSDNARLHVDAPKGVLSGDLRAAIAARKAELLDLLRAEQERERLDIRFRPGDRVWLLDYHTGRPRYTESELVVDVERDDAGTCWVVLSTTSLAGKSHVYRWLAQHVALFEACPACGSENRLARPDGIVECRGCQAIEAVPAA